MCVGADFIACVYMYIQAWVHIDVVYIYMYVYVRMYTLLECV